VAVVLALLVVAFFAETIALLFFKSGKNNQPVRGPQWSLWLVDFLVFAFFASGLAHNDDRQ